MSKKQIVCVFQAISLSSKLYNIKNLLLSGKTQITYKSLRNCLYIGNSAFFFEIQAP